MTRTPDGRYRTTLPELLWFLVLVIVATTALLALLLTPAEPPGMGEDRWPPPSVPRRTRPPAPPAW